MLYLMVYPYMVLHRDMFICYSIWSIFLCYYIGICSYGISSYVITYGISSYVIIYAIWYVRCSNVIKYTIHCHVSMFVHDHVIIIFFSIRILRVVKETKIDFSNHGFLLITMVTRFEFYYVIMFSSVFPIYH